MEIGGKSRGEDPETSGAGVWEGQKDRDCGRSQVDQGGKVSREAGTSLVGPVGMERNLYWVAIKYFVLPSKRTLSTVKVPERRCHSSRKLVVETVRVPSQKRSY